MQVSLYQIHHPDPRTDIEETLSALADVMREGKVRAIGTSNFPASDLVEAQWVAGMSVSYDPPAITRSALRRRAAGERAAA